MTGTEPVLETSLSDLKLTRRGKVRDVYEVDDDHLLIVATDRISAFDCVLPTPIARKGEVLTALSRFWFEKLGHIVPNHLVTTDIDEMPETVAQHEEVLRGRSMLVRRTEVFPIECVVRGYLVGLAGRTISARAKFAGIACRQGLRESEQLPEPIFTPATKAEEGHDENISEARMSEILGAEVTAILRDISLQALHGGERLRAHARHHHRRYEIRVRQRSRRAHHSD